MLTELEMRANEEARHAHRELVEELEAKLAKAVEALQEIADPISLALGAINAEIARTTLAELNYDERSEKKGEDV